MDIGIKYRFQGVEKAAIYRKTEVHNKFSPPQIASSEDQAYSEGLHEPF